MLKSFIEMAHSEILEYSEIKNKIQDIEEELFPRLFIYLE